MNTRPLLGRAGTTAVAWLARAVRLAFAALAVVLTGAMRTAARIRHLGNDTRVTLTGRTEHRADDHSVTVIAIRDGRPMAVAVDFPFIGRATTPALTRAGGVAVPGTGIGDGHPPGAFREALLGPPARAPALPPN